MSVSTPPTESAADSVPVSTADHRLSIGLLTITLLFWFGFVAIAISQAALPPERAGTVVAVFPPGFAKDRIFATLLEADGRLVNSTWLDAAWVVHSDRPGFVARLKTLGAWAAFEPSVLQPITIGGCFLVLTEPTAVTVSAPAVSQQQ